MSKFIEVTVEGKKRIISIINVEIFPPDEFDQKVNICDHHLCRNIYPDETYEEIKAMLGIVKG